MPCGGRDPVSVSASVGMKEAKGVPAPKPDKGALRQASQVRRTFLTLRSRLRAWAELRRRGRAQAPTLLEAREVSALGWTAQGAGASPGGGGGTPGGGPVQNTGPPILACALGSHFATAARSITFGAVMASLAGSIASICSTT